MKEIKIEVPNGYEIDKENSTFEKIVLKPIKVVNSWEDFIKIDGFFITSGARIVRAQISVFDKEQDRNVFLNEKYAKSALALAQISQLLPYYDTNVNWDDCDKPKYCIIRRGNEADTTDFYELRHLLAFNTIAEAERFLKYNEQLVKDYLMIDDENYKI